MCRLSFSISPCLSLNLSVHFCLCIIKLHISVPKISENRVLGFQHVSVRWSNWLSAGERTITWHRFKLRRKVQKLQLAMFLWTGINSNVLQCQNHSRRVFLFHAWHLFLWTMLFLKSNLKEIQHYGVVLPLV